MIATIKHIYNSLPAPLANIVYSYIDEPFTQFIARGYIEYIYQFLKCNVHDHALVKFVCDEYKHCDEIVILYSVGCGSFYLVDKYQYSAPSKLLYAYIEYAARENTDEVISVLEHRFAVTPPDGRSSILYKCIKEAKYVTCPNQKDAPNKVLEWLVKRAGFSSNIGDIDKIWEAALNVINNTARSGVSDESRMSVATWLHEFAKIPLTPTTMKYVIKNGMTYMLQWAHDNMPGDYKNILMMSGMPYGWVLESDSKKSLDVSTWLYENKYTWMDILAHVKYQVRNPEVFLYLRSIKMPMGVTTRMSASAHLPLSQFADEVIDINTLGAAVRYGSAEMIDHVFRRAVRELAHPAITSKMISEAAHGSFAHLKIIYKWRRLINDDKKSQRAVFINYLLRIPDQELLIAIKWLRRHMRSKEMYIIMITRERLDIIQWMHQLRLRVPGGHRRARCMRECCSADWLMRAMYLAVRLANLPIIKWVHARTTSSLSARWTHDILRSATEHAFKPLDHNLDDTSIDRRVATLRWVYKTYLAHITEDMIMDVLNLLMGALNSNLLSRCMVIHVNSLLERKRRELKG